MSAEIAVPLKEQVHTYLAEALIKLGRRHRLLRVIREQEAEVLALRLGLTVRSGPAAGLKLIAESSWGRSDLPNKILGIYEQSVHAFIDRACPTDRVVCIGAADGYYGVGLVASGKARSSVCFEMSEAGRSVIAKTAAHNGVANKVEIEGKADASTLQSCLAAETNSPNLFIVDIEGAEFDLFNEAVLSALSRHYVLIEVHPHKVHDGPSAQRSLIADASKYFQVDIIRDGGRDIPLTPELAGLSDDQRCVICSEAREHQMEWLALTPR